LAAAAELTRRGEKRAREDPTPGPGAGAASTGTKTAGKAVQGLSRNGGLTPAERVKQARAKPGAGQHLPSLRNGKVHCERCGRSYQENGTKKFLATSCLGRSATKAEVIGAAKAARGRQRHEKEADEARQHNATAAPGDLRHVLLPDDNGVHCEVCGARSWGTELANRARLAKRVCPGAKLAPTEEDLKRRAFERDRKRAYLARRRAQDEELQRRAAPGGAAPSKTGDTAKRPRQNDAAAAKRRGRAAPAAPE